MLQNSCIHFGIQTRSIRILHFN